MLTRLRSRLTYPHIVSTIALFLALTGGAFALQGKNSVDSGDIKKDNVKSSDIKSPNGVKTGDVTDNGLTGTDIDESTLGQVPSALNANNANNATNAENAQNAANAQNAQNAENASSANNANAVDGVSAAGIRFRAGTSTGDTNILTLGGLTLTASCSAGGDPGLVATTSVGNATLTSGQIDASDDSVGQDSDTEEDFDTAESVDLSNGDDTETTMSIQYTRPPLNLIQGSSATSVFLQSERGSGDVPACIITGHALSSSGSGNIFIPFP